MHWRDRDWWGLQQAIGLVIDPRNVDLDWRHDRPGRRLQWEDVFVRSFGHSWKQSAAQQEWKATAGDFIRAAYSHLDARVIEDRFRQPKPRKQSSVDVHERVPILWQDVCDRMHRIEFLGDSMVVVNWVRGVWDTK